MCTIGCKRIKGKGFVVFKNRDIKKDTGLKALKEGKEPGCVKVMGVYDSYGHFEGISENKVVVVHAALKNKKSIIVPTLSAINRYIVQSKSAKDAVRIIKNNALSGNIIVADEKEAFSIEKTPYSISVKKIKNFCVMANHSERLKGEGCRGKERKESIERKKKAHMLLKKAKTVDDIKKILRNTDGKGKICNNNTKSSYIFITKKKEMMFSKKSPCKARYVRYKL